MNENTNNLPAPVAWLDAEGSAWTAEHGLGAEEMADAHPDYAPFTPLYRLTDLPALALPEVTDEDADAKAALTAATGDLDALRAEGWVLVCQEGGR